MTLSVCTWAWIRVHSRKVGPLVHPNVGDVLCDPLFVPGLGAGSTAAKSAHLAHYHISHVDFADPICCVVLDCILNQQIIYNYKIILKLPLLDKNRKLKYMKFLAIIHISNLNIRRRKVRRQKVRQRKVRGIKGLAPEGPQNIRQEYSDTKRPKYT